jgi:hypothetical protein
MSITLVLRDEEWPLWSDYASDRGAIFRDMLRVEALDLGRIFHADTVILAYRDETLAMIEVPHEKSKDDTGSL